MTSHYKEVQNLKQKIEIKKSNLKLVKCLKKNCENRVTDCRLVLHKNFKPVERMELSSKPNTDRAALQNMVAMKA